MAGMVLIVTDTRQINQLKMMMNQIISYQRVMH